MSEPTSPAEPVDEVDEFTQNFLDAMDRRFPVETTPEPVSAEEQPAEEPAPAEPVSAETPRDTETPAEGGTPDEGEATPAEPRDSAPAFTLSGVDYTPQQVTQAIQVHDWFARLDANQVQAIDALMSGGYRLAPLNEPAPGPQTPSPAGTAISPPPPAPAADDEGEWLDPRAQAAINQLRGQINDLQQNFTQSLGPVVQTQQQADYNTRFAAINTAHSSFQTKYGLTDEAMQSLEASIAEGQILPGLANRHGSLEAGMNAALEMIFWTTPTYRDPYVQSRVTSQQAEQHTEQTATTRKQQLTALSGSGGSVPRREPVPTTPEDRHAAMVNEIAAAMNGSGQVE